MKTEVTPDGGVKVAGGPVRQGAYPVRKLLPVENVILGNGKMPRQAGDKMTVALIAILKQQLAEQDGNTVYIVCSRISTPDLVRNYLNEDWMPRFVYDVHPDLVFEVVQNVMANPEIKGDETKPRKYVRLFIDLPDFTNLCLLPDGKSHSLQFSHRLLNEAAHYVDSISATVDMNIRGVNGTVQQA